MTGTFYFAYGSNLSPFQMSQRCTSSPSSSIPIAIGRLDKYEWFICQRGYANVKDLTSSKAEAADSAVWGVLYNLTQEDEDILDGYEGVSSWRNSDPDPNPNSADRVRKPFLQGNWDYNKLYLPLTITKWLVPPEGFFSTGQSSTSVRALVYVDEERLRTGDIITAYIGRMNRGIDESVALGMPRDWIEKTMRRWVTPGILPPQGYIGTNEGYVPDQETEASQPVKDWEANGHVEAEGWHSEEVELSGHTATETWQSVQQGQANGHQEW